jgi:hypothetical protein
MFVSLIAFMLALASLRDPHADGKGAERQGPPGLAPPET